MTPHPKEIAAGVYWLQTSLLVNVYLVRSGSSSGPDRYGVAQPLPVDP